MIELLAEAGQTLPNWLDGLKNQGPLALLVLAAFAAGSRKVWYFGHQVESMKMAWDIEKTQLIKDRDIQYTKYDNEILQAKVEKDSDRVRVKAEAEEEGQRLQKERERAEARAQKYEEYTFRLLEAASTATRTASTVIASRGEG